MNDRPKEIPPAGEARHNAATSGQNVQKSLRVGRPRPEAGQRTMPEHAAGMGQERLSGRTADYKKAEGRMSKKLPEIERTPAAACPA